MGSLSTANPPLKGNVMNYNTQIDFYQLEKNAELDLQVYKQKVEIEYLNFKNCLLEESIAFYQRLLQIKGV